MTDYFKIIEDSELSADEIIKQAQATQKERIESAKSSAKKDIENYKLEIIIENKRIIDQKSSESEIFLKSAEVDALNAADDIYNNCDQRKDEAILKVAEGIVMFSAHR